MTTKTTVRCTQCQGTNVQRMHWVDPNTRTIDDEPCFDHASIGADASGVGGFATTWCAGCEDHTELEEVAA